MYLLDTDTLTHFHLGKAAVRAKVAEVGEANVATTVVTEIEIMQGRQSFMLKASDGQQLLRAQELLHRSRELLDAIEIRLFDERAAAKFDAMRQEKKLGKIGRPDLLVACIALASNSILVTRNLRDFRLVPGLRLENWM